MRFRTIWFLISLLSAQRPMTSVRRSHPSHRVAAFVQAGSPGVRAR
jgi:hypothetical protein